MTLTQDLALGDGTPFPEMGTQIYGYEHGRVSIYPCMRDHIARKEDESTGFVFPNHYLFKIAEQPLRT